VDYSGEQNGTGLNGEQSETAANSRVSFESSRAEFQRRNAYHEDQLRSREDYSGFVDIWNDDERRAVFRELLTAFACDEHDYPLPCTGLPGFLHTLYDEDEPAAELLQLGMDYLLAIFRNERRTMHFRWREAREFIRRIEKDTERRILDGVTEREMQRATAVEEQRAAAGQRVYFIGAASGPIKIGIAVSPQNWLKGLQTGHHERLELLATCEGGQEQERAYHELFAGRRLHGEWFERCPEIEAEIARLQLLEAA
jgi:hypothetical protein